MKAIVAFCALTAPHLPLAITTASADEVGHWYVNPQFGGISVDNRRPVEDKDWLYGLGIGKHVSQYPRAWRRTSMAHRSAAAPAAAI